MQVHSPNVVLRDLKCCRAVSVSLLRLSSEASNHIEIHSSRVNTSADRISEETRGLDVNCARRFRFDW